MKIPKISVVVITARPGGIDVLLRGLVKQQFDRNDFEVVLVDALYHRRREVVADAFSAAKIHLVHIPTRERIFPVDACPQARNAAIAKAHGELLLWTVDYTYLPENNLAEHWGVYEYFNKERTGMGAHKYLQLPSIAYEVPKYAPVKMFTPNSELGVTYGYNESASKAFITDLVTGFYDPYMYSIFAEPFGTQEVIELREDPEFFQVDPKLHGKIGATISGNFFHGKNETTTRDLAIAVNGFDESYTGHLYDDTDFGHRLEHAGAKWILLDTSICAEIVNPRHLFPHLIRRAALEAHRERYDARRSDSSCVVSGNNYNLNDVKDWQWWYE